MTDLEYELLQKILKLAIKKGYQFTEIYFEETDNQLARILSRKLDTLSFGATKGVGIRVIDGNSVGYAFSSELSKQSLLDTLEASAYLAKSKADFSSNSVEIKQSRKSQDENFLDLDKQIYLLKISDEAAWQQKEIVQVASAISSQVKYTLLLNSEGLSVSQNQQRTHFSTRVVAKGDSGIHTGYEVAAQTGDSSFLTEDIVKQTSLAASKMALIKLQARPAPTGEMPVILAKGSGGILFHEACGHGLEADHILKGASQFCGLLNQQVAAPAVTLVDDPTVKGQWGAFEIDDEGNKGTETVLIKNGVLLTYMADLIRAKAMGLKASNGRRESYKHPPMVRMTNTFIQPGNLNPDEILQDTKKAIYVSRLSGGQVNTTTGDFVFGTMEAYLVEDGKITAPIRDANLIGNGLRTLSLIDAVGNDFDMSPGTCGKDGQQVPVGCGMPTLRVARLTVGGTAK